MADSAGQSSFPFADARAPDHSQRPQAPHPALDPAPRAYAELAVEVPLRRTFFYRIPEAMREHVHRGCRLRVPFGGQQRTAYYLRAARLDEARALVEQGVRLRDAAALLDKKPLLDETLVTLAWWMADHYRCSLGEAMSAMVPAGVKRRVAAQRVSFAVLAAGREAALAAAGELESRGRRSPKQAQMLRALVLLGGRASVAELLSAADGSRAQLKGLREKGLVRVVSEAAGEDPLAAYASDAEEQLDPPSLTSDQARALGTIRTAMRAGRFGVFLLHGVTGSGKTEVYLRAIGEAAGRGRSAIVLVPEISLTPQTTERFRARFERVVLLHSHLTEGQRAEAWHRIAAGEAQVVIGARSAIFAPIPQLGLIVIDEEHETSYKQDKVPRYHARDVAQVRAKLARALLLLGSATPSLETARLVERGAAERLALPVRVAGRPLPPVEIVDMRDESRKRFTILSRALESRIAKSLEAGEQVILFLNRRGFATYIHCPRCGYILTCSRCAVAMTLHRARKKVVCHYCGREDAPPNACPACALPGILYHGTGTERIEQVIADRFAGARIARMDSDTMRERTAYARVLGAFRRGEVDILVGTQMIAKGLDFPNVTVIGIIKADMALNLADFRASERTFQLIAQVAGRTGRGPKGGCVVVQTSMPDNVAIRAAAEHDYQTFARAELVHRRAWGYPPYTHLVRIIVRSGDEEAVKARAEQVHAALTAAWREAARADPPPSDPDALPEHEGVLPPAICPIPMVRGEHRRHLLARAHSAARLAARLERAAAELDRTVSGVELVIDVDPVNML